MDDDGYDRWMDCWGKFHPVVVSKTLSNFTPQQNFPYVRKSYFVSHEIHFQDGQPGFWQRWPNVWAVFNLANFSRPDDPKLDLLGLIFYTLGINLTSGLMPDNVAIT